VQDCSPGPICRISIEGDYQSSGIRTYGKARADGRERSYRQQRYNEKRKDPLRDMQLRILESPSIFDLDRRKAQKTNASQLRSLSMACGFISSSHSFTNLSHLAKIRLPFS